MRIEFDMPSDVEEEIREIIVNAVKQAMQQFQKQPAAKEWMTLKEGARYAGVSMNTFKKFTIDGLKLSRPESVSVQLVSRKEIDLFLESCSY